MEHQWFVVHTLSGQEQKVKESIEKRLKTEEMEEYIREVLLPMEKVAEVRGGKKTVTNRKLYPGYVFIDMLLLDDEQRLIEKPWYFIRETQGIIGFVGGDRPTPAPREEIDRIKQEISESEDKEKPKVNFEVGETVTWRNDSALVHTVTGKPSEAASAESVALPEGAEPWGSGRLGPGETFEHTFEVAGKYQYFCIPHEGADMYGYVTVEE